MDFLITVYNSSTDPFYNQAFEEYIFRNFTGEEVFLLWQNSPSVIVGSYQNICREVHVETLRRLNIPVVRRISGGGTVYHDLGNINYSYIINTDGEMDYARCLSPIISALNAIGVPAQRSRSCDIAINGLKISGSAQRSEKGRLLHHGTLLFQSDLDMLERITTHHKNECFQTKGTLSAICPVTNIQSHLPFAITLEEFKERLLNQMVPQSNRIRLSPEQQTEVQTLRDLKYCSWDWTWGKTPAFSYEKNGIFDGYPIHISYQAKKGILSDAAIDCEIINRNQAAELLNDSRLDPELFAEICRRLAPNRAEKLMDWLI